MPTYVFLCKECRQEFQLKTSWREKAAARCPACGSQELQEQFGRYHLYVNSGRSKEIPRRCEGCSNAPACHLES